MTREKDKGLTASTRKGIFFYMSHALALSLLVIIAMAAHKFNDIGTALAFYGVYHRDPINQLIHFFGVPLIIWTVLVAMAFLPFPFLGNLELKHLPFITRHHVTYGTIVSLGYVAFYINIDRFGGCLYTPVLYAMYATAVNFADKDMKESEIQRTKEKISSTRMGIGKAFKTACWLHLLGWYAQIHPGHAIFEGAKPALLDSLGGALTSAPLFAFYEGLWFLGINLDLQEQTQSLVAEYTAELCAAGSSMRVCGSA